MMKTVYLMVFTATTLFIQCLCLSIYFFAKVDNEVGLVLEILELIPICSLVTGMFNRCPICGKRKLAKWVRCSGTRYTLYDAECRNCKSKISIELDRDLCKRTYFSNENNAVIKPIWEIKK